MSFRFGLYYTLKTNNKKDISVDKKKKIIKSVKKFEQLDDKTYLNKFLELVFEYCKDQNEMFKPSVNDLPFEMKYKDSEHILEFDLKDFPISLRWVLYGYCKNISNDI